MRYFKRAGFVIATMILIFFIAYGGNVTFIPVAAAQSASEEAARIAAEAAAKAKVAREKAEADRKEAEEKAKAAAKAAREKAEADRKEREEKAKVAAERARIEAAAAAERVRKSFDIDMDMVFVRGGTFMMGCTPEQGSDCYQDETPAHRVTLDNFYIGKYEVTQAQWRAITGNTPTSSSTGDNLPVVNVSWNEVQGFINGLNQKTGDNYRLPTEVEWEYAARGGSQSQGYKYSGSNNIGEVAWYENNSGKKINPVGTKKPNELAIYDMSGNVYEWVNDWYGDYNSSPQTNPKGPSSGSKRVLRSGSWSSPARITRVSDRDNDNAVDRYNNVGFRLARSAN